jgi:diguanylate cyclase
VDSWINSNSFFKALVHFPIFPKDDPKQVLRIRRFFMASTVYILCGILMYVSYLAGIMEWQGIAGCLIIAPVINITLYIVFRTGLNRRMDDPSLTLVQICAGILVSMYAMYFANEARGVMLLVYVIILMFGIFRFHYRSFLYLSVFTLLTYGGDIALLHYFRPEEVNFHIEYLQWVVLALVLVAFSIIGGYISALRHNLSISRLELEKSISTIRELSIHDELTGVYNRRHFLELLEYEKNRSSRGGALFSIVMLDIDNFKIVNDNYGHLVGDEVLRAVTTAISNALRSTDFCGRYGGDEFLLVLTQSDIDSAMICAERVRSSIEQSIFPDLGPDIKITVSLGLTEYHIREDIGKMIARADEALYCAKKSGRNRLEQIV